MRFTFPILTLCIGGAQRMLAEIINGLVRRGHDVTIIMPPQGVIEYPIHARVIRTKKDYTIQESDYPNSDIVVSNFHLVVPSAQAASSNKKGIHVRLSLCYEPTFLPDNDVTFPTYHLTPHLVVLSKWQQELIYLNHGIKGHIVPVGISTSFSNLKIRNPHSPLNISAIIRKPEGGFSWHREQDYLLKHLKRVKKLYPNVRINLFTPPNEFASSPILQSIKAQGLFRHLTPADDRELNYHYNETDIFVSSSTYDSASLPGLEAMKCGAALVTTYAGGNMDYCQHEKNALVSYRYQHRLSEDIIRLINHPQIRQNLAAEGEKEAAKWTWERSVSLFENAMKRIIQHRK